MITRPAERSFSKLRISITNHCNFSCLYCVSDYEHKNKIQHQPDHNEHSENKQPLQLDEYLDIISCLHQKLNLKSIKITGGEPLLFAEIEDLVSGIKQIGVPQVSLTTNGFLLKRKAKSLKRAGLDAMNVSLDALHPDVFRKMSRNGMLQPVLEGIDEAIANGFNLKINTVIMKGVNENQTLPLLDFALQKKILLRYIELMKMGPLHENINQYFYSTQNILDSIRAKYSINALAKEVNDTSNYWAIDGKKAFGIIANESIPFCSDCNRLRLDSYGNIYGCLSKLIAINIKDDYRIASRLEEKLTTALSHKQEEKFSGNKKTMKSIGG